MVTIYWGVMVLGLCVFLAIILFIMSEPDNVPLKAFWFGGLGLICAGYAVQQLARPAPLPRAANGGSDSDIDSQ